MAQKKRKRTERVTRDSDNFREISVSPEYLDSVVNAFGARSYLTKETAEDKEKKTQLIKSVYKAAADVLTDIQFRIFVMRYAFNMKEKDIASQMDCHQTYVTLVLQHSTKRIKKHLGVNKGGKREHKILFGE